MSAAGHRVGRRSALTELSGLAGLVGLGALLLGGCARAQRVPEQQAPPGPQRPPLGTPRPAEPTPRLLSWESAAALARVTAAVSVPAGTDPTALHPVIVLHGLGGDHGSALRAGLVAAQQRAIAGGVPPFAAVSVDGGGYYHPRRSGEDYQAMVLTELLERLGQHVDVSRVGFAGFSMGGYGALLLGSILGPERCRAAAAASPAVWVAGDSPAPGAFDGAEDYRRWSLFNRIPALARIPSRIEAPLDDPFRSADRRLAEALRAGGGSVKTRFDQPGEHSEQWWGQVLEQQLRFCAARFS